MKRYQLVALACTMIFVLWSIKTNAQEKPIIIHPLIGDTLDAQARNFYKLFPGIEGFQSAVFFLNPDSTLKVHVEFFEDGIKRDTLIARYKKLISVQNQIEQINSITQKYGATEQPISQIVLKNGSLIRGIIIGKSKDSVRVMSENIGILALPVEQIERVESDENIFTEDKVSVPVNDPNVTSEFFMPTGQTDQMGKGSLGGFLGVPNMLIFTAGVGLTDFITIGGGVATPTMYFSEEAIAHFNAKIRLFRTQDNVSFAAGIFGFTIPRSNPFTVAYGAISFGDQNGKFNICFGSPLTTKNYISWILGISGDIRASSSLKFIGELWLSPEASYLYSIVGLRIFGKNISGDLGIIIPVSTHGRDYEYIGSVSMAKVMYHF